VFRQACRTSQIVEFTANQGGVGVAELGEDGESAVPGLNGGGGMPSREVSVAEVSQSISLAIADPEFAKQLPRLLVMRDSLLIPAEVLVGTGNAAERLGLAKLITYFLLQVVGSLAVHEPHFVAAQLNMEPADGVQGPGLPGPVPRSPEQLECLLRMGESLLVAALLIEYPGQAPVSVCLTGLVAKVLVKLEGVQEVSMGVVVTAQAGRGIRKAAVAFCLRIRVS